MMRIAVIIAAGGSSRRYAGGVHSPRSKLDEDLGGRPVLQRTVELFTKDDRISGIIVGGPAGEAFAEFRERYGASLGFLGATLCPGGITHRWETVREALGHVGAEATHIAVHDGARPCTPPALLERLFDAAQRHPAVIPALAVTDTLKEVEEVQEGGTADPLAAILGESSGGPARRVTRTIERRGLVAVQTPQIFRADLLRRAYAQSNLESTDDAQLVERLGETVTVIEGDRRNVKITVPADLDLARAILGTRPPEGRPAHKRF